MENDITVLLYGIKSNIRKVEAGDRDCLYDIECDFLQLMELLKLFLISERETYYGYFLMNMSFNVEFTEETIAGIALNQYPPVFCTNPLLLCKFSLKEIIFILCHEIEHLILNHPAEMIKVNPTRNPDIYKRFNYAADASVNDRLIHDMVARKIKYMSFPDGCVDSEEFSNIFKLGKIRSNENYLYYYNLISDLDDSQSDSVFGMLSGMTGASENTGNGDKASNKQSAVSSDNDTILSDQGDLDADSDNIITAQNCKNPKTHQWDCGDDYEGVSELVKEYVNESYKMISSDSRGKMPAGFISQVEKLNEKPQISWEKVLKKYVGTINAGYRKTRTRLNRRQPERFDISGKMEDKTLKIVVAIDTSGSVGDNEISKIFNEIFDILSKKKFELTIIECDADIKRVYKARNRNEVDTSVRGRGGTCFTPVIEYLNADKYYRDALLIYFTDGYGEVKIPKPMTYRNMWVVLYDEKNLSLEEPYGVVLKM